MCDSREQINVAEIHLYDRREQINASLNQHFSSFVETPVSLNEKVQAHKKRMSIGSDEPHPLRSTS
jgi:hypothetical protein